MSTGSIAKYGMAVGLSAASFGLLWVGTWVLEDAALRASSTFELQRGAILLGSGLLALSGAVFSMILMIRARRDRRYGYLVAAAVVPAIIASLPFLYLWNVFSATWLRWAYSPEIRSASAFAVGAILAHIVWRATGPRHVEEPT